MFRKHICCSLTHYYFVLQGEDKRCKYKQIGEPHEAEPMPNYESSTQVMQNCTATHLLDISLNLIYQEQVACSMAYLGAVLA
jgi:hypothetical protein